MLLIEISVDEVVAHEYEIRLYQAAVNTANTTIYSSGRTVAAADVEGLVIVETPDAVMVCSKEKAQNVKLIVDELNAKSRKELL